MILEEETFKAYGYYPSNLKHRSGKRVLATCDGCGKVRITSKDLYRSLCISCALKGNIHASEYKHTEEANANMSAVMKGEKNPFFGKHHTEDSKALMCKNHADYKGKKNPNYGVKMPEDLKAKLRVINKGNTYALGYIHSVTSKALISAACIGERHFNFGKRGKDANGYKCGRKISRAKSEAKRKRDLGYTLLMPLKPGEEAHHFTNEHVIGVPAEVHRSFSGPSRKKHRTRVLQWLKVNDKKKYLKVLCVLAKEPLEQSS